MTTIIFKKLHLKGSTVKLEKATVLTEPTSHAAASPWPTFWIACIAVFLVSIDSTVLFAAFGALQAAFPSATPADLSWVLNAYTIVYAAMLIPAGGLADARGRKRVFLFGVTLFLAASAACGMADGLAWLIVARVVQALGAALLTPASLSIILDAFPKEKRAVAVSLWGAVGGLAAAIGPSLGSSIVEHLGWPWAFYINLPLGAVSLWCGARRLREAAVPGKRARIDLPGVLLLIVAVGALAMAITQLDSPHWSGLELAALALAGVVGFGAFIAWARTATAPLVDLGGDHRAAGRTRGRDAGRLPAAVRHACGPGPGHRGAVPGRQDASGAEVSSLPARKSPGHRHAPRDRPGYSCVPAGASARLMR
jgi:MFS family permease